MCTLSTLPALQVINDAAPLPGASASTGATHPDLSWQQKLAGLILSPNAAPGIAPNGKGSNVYAFPSTMSPQSAVTFNPPSSIVHIGQAGPASFQTELLAVPTSPGRSKVSTCHQEFRCCKTMWRLWRVDVSVVNQPCVLQCAAFYLAPNLHMLCSPSI